MSQIIYFTDDLLFSSRIVDAARRGGWTLEVTSNSDLLQYQLKADDLRLLIVDLSARGAAFAELIATARQRIPALPIVAYGPHVDVDRLAEAERAGCTEVLSRGSFSRAPQEVMLRYLPPQPAP
ncbi:MAG: hypothetical protein FJ295_17630 [Planctomycetes bacterium]|nr:hypothetical protein [Planctomycetota bacterium]